MKPSIPRLLALTALAATPGLPSLHAQLTGTTQGAFADPAVLHTTITNGPVTSLFSSGVPYRPQNPYKDTPTSITFTGTSFVDADDEDFIFLGKFKIKNGITLLGTTASTASMDLLMDLPSYGVWDFKLTTFVFAIDNTANTGVSVPDLFFIGYTAPATLSLPNFDVTFDLGFTDPSFNTGSGRVIAENKSGSTGIFAELHFAPVPEPATYGAAAAALLAGVVIARRRRASATSARALA